MTPPGLRDRKKQQTRSALMTAALELVAARGLDHVTVEEISEAADVSPRTFFNYFASKDDAVIGDPFADGPSFRDRLLAMPDGMPLLDAVRRVFAVETEQIQADRDVWLLRMRVVHDNPSLLLALFAKGTAAEKDSIAAIAERAGLPGDALFAQLAASVMGAAFRAAMMRWAAAPDEARLSDFVDEAFGHLADGFTRTSPSVVSPADVPLSEDQR